MFNAVSFQCTALKGQNKAGLIKPDPTGYRTVVLGALDIFNSAGQFYTYEDAKSLFTESSTFMRKVQQGALRGEHGHPKPWPGMTNDAWCSRILDVYEDRVCVHIRKVWLDFDKVKDRDGKKVIAIMGEVKPAGELGHILEQSFNNPDENVAFSIRCFTDVDRKMGRTNKAIRHIVTWDHVLEPGIHVADKYYSPALESNHVKVELENTFTRGQLERAFQADHQVGVSTESARLNAMELFTSLGWKPDVTNKPSFLRW